MEFPLPKDHCLRMMYKIFQMRDQPSLCDISIVVEDKIYCAHKCVLNAACPILHEIIVSESESAQRESLQLTLQGLTCKGFEALLEYIYTGVPPRAKHSLLFQDFQKACRALGVPEMKHRDIVDNRKAMKGQKLGKDNDHQNGESMHVEYSTDSQIVVEVVTSAPKEEDSGEEKEDEDYEMLLPEELGYGSDILEGNEANRRRNKGYSVVAQDPGTSLYNGDNRNENEDYAYDLDDVESDLEQENMFPCNAGEMDDSQVDGVLTDNGQQSDSLDISTLFSVQKRLNKTEDQIDDEDLTQTQEEDCEKPDQECVKESEMPIVRRQSCGRPRVANDHIFPVKPPYICPHRSCVKIFETREKLKKHHRNHEEKTHPCDICGKKFLYKKDVSIHRRIHTGEKPYECSWCGLCFGQKSVLTNHILTHSKGQKFPCLSCDKTYTSVRTLAIHVREKHKRRSFTEISCGTCHEAYVTNGPYLLHKENSCTDVRHLCLKCGNQFKLKNVFQKHVRVCEAKIKGSKIKTRARSSGFKCALCGKVFGGKRNLSNHIQFDHDIYPMKDEHFSITTKTKKNAHVYKVEKSKSNGNEKVEIIDFSEILFEEV